MLGVVTGAQHVQFIHLQHLNHYLKSNPTMAKDPYRYFRIEATELLDQLGKGILDLEKGDFKSELMSRLLRLAHTIKGAARVVKQVEIADLSHGLEDLLVPYREATERLPRDCVDGALQILDAMAKKLTELPLPENDSTPVATEKSGQSDVLLQPEESPVRMVRSDLVEVDTLLEGLGEIGSELGGMKRMVGSIDRIRFLTTQMTEARNLSQEKLKQATEEIHSLLSTAERSMSAGILRIDRELRQASDAAERLMLIPIVSIFNSLERTARDAAQMMGKQVEFQAMGGDVRIEGTMLDTVQSALIQLVRNAVAHGIEPMSQRGAKPLTGRIILTVERRGYRVCFRCRDDGAGIDLDAVRRALVKKNNASAGIEKLNPEALIARLLKGGVSTASTVTEIAGRGIGLDMVHEAVQKLNGEIVARTEQGLGTSFELSVPLSIAALDVLFVENQGMVAALPLDAVRRTLRITPQEIIATPHGNIIVYENKQIPFAPLQLGMPDKKSRQKIVSDLRAVTVVVVASRDAGDESVDKSANESVETLSAVAVERLRGMDTVILRALPDSCPTDQVVLGVHLDGEGNPGLVLDPDVLARRCWVGAASSMVAPEEEQKAPALPILIIDDSLTTRMLESSILESAGYTVELATCAEQGLEMVRRNRYALILVDVEMPGMNGFEFVTQVKADPVLNHLPCILVTSCNSEEDRRRGAASGASAYIVKGDFDQVEFLQRVATLVAYEGATNGAGFAEMATVLRHQPDHKPDHRPDHQPDIGSTHVARQTSLPAPSRSFHID